MQGQSSDKQDTSQLREEEKVYKRIDTSHDNHERTIKLTVDKNNNNNNNNNNYNNNHS